MKKALGEIIGTFLLVFIGTGSVILNHLYGGKISLLGISLITGLVVSLMIIAFGKWSGAHMNPAVTIALASRGEVDKKDILPYILFQAVGAFAGSFLLSIIFPSSKTLGETVPSLNLFWAFFIEIGITFFLMFVILYASLKLKLYAAWIIGAAVAIGIFVGGNYSGGSMNPIRSLSPAVLNNNVGQVWLFLTAPFIGSLLAVYIFKKIVK